MVYRGIISYIIVLYITGNAYNAFIIIILMQYYIYPFILIYIKGIYYVMNVLVYEYSNYTNVNVYYIPERCIRCIILIYYYYNI